MGIKSTAKTLLVASIGLALAAAPAAAEISSVDAYSGQAAVLGAPRTHDKQGNKVTANGGSDRSGGTHARAGSQVGSGSSQAPPSGGAGGSTRGRAAGAGATGGGAGSSTASGTDVGTGVGPGAVAARQPTGSALAAGGETGGSLSLSALDVLLLLALLACLLGVAVLMRRLGRHAQ